VRDGGAIILFFGIVGGVFSTLGMNIGAVNFNEHFVTVDKTIDKKEKVRYKPITPELRETIESILLSRLENADIDVKELLLSLNEYGEVDFKIFFLRKKKNPKRREVINGLFANNAKRQKPLSQDSACCGQNRHQSRNQSRNRKVATVLRIWTRATRKLRGVPLHLRLFITCAPLAALCKMRNAWRRNLPVAALIPL
jgi:hypothetical protein